MTPLTVFGAESGGWRVWELALSGQKGPKFASEVWLRSSYLSSAAEPWCWNFVKIWTLLRKLPMHSLLYIEYS